MTPEETNIIFYTTPNGQISIQVQYEDGSFWLTQRRMAELFGVDIRTINERLTSKTLCLDWGKNITFASNT